MIMETLVKARKLGGSIIVTIPKVVAEQEGIIPGVTVSIKVKKAKSSGFGVLKGIGPFTHEDELDVHE